MNKIFPIIFLTSLSFLFVILQSTLFSPKRFGVFHPDLNLILIIFLGLFSVARGSAIIAAGGGYMMDVLSGYMFGIHTLSRLSVYTILKGFSDRVYPQNEITQAIAIFFSTLFTWGFVWAGLYMKTHSEFEISLGGVMTQGMINILVGLPLLWIIKKFYARVQK